MLRYDKIDKIYLPIFGIKNNNTKEYQLIWIDMYCRNCGNQIEEDFVYCDKCGDKILIKIDEKKVSSTYIYLPVLGIIIGEFLIFYGKIYQGIGIHIINILAILLVIIFSNLALETKNTLQSLTLLPILRIISLSIPQLFANIYFQHILVYGIMLIPIYMIIKNQHISYKESITALSILLYSPLSFGRVYIYAPTVILIITMILMIGQYTGIIPDIQTPSAEVTYIIGEFASIFLIIILSILFLVSDTKYWNKYISNTLDTYSNPLLLTFVAIVIYKIIIII